MTFRRLMVVLFAFALLAAACGDDDTTTEGPADEPAGEPAEESSGELPEGWPDKIVFGFVPSQEQTELQDDIQPFIDVLQEGLGIEVEGRVTTDYTGLVTAMGTGTADLGAFGPFGYTLGADEFGNIEALIQSIRFGSATYHGQWIANDPSICTEPPVEGSALENQLNGEVTPRLQGGEIVQVDALDAVALQVGVYIEDGNKLQGDTTEGGDTISPGYSCVADISAIAGRTVAFTTESSTSGYLFPALELLNAGIDPDADINATFAGGHDAAVIAVYNGDADIGISYDDARREISDESPDVGEKVIVFSITDEIPNDVVAIRKDLPQSFKDAVYDTVADYLATPEGEEVFAEIYEWTDIRPAVESDFDIVREAAQALGITEPPD